MANIVCHHNIQTTKSIVSAGFARASGGDLTFGQQYLTGTADYFIFVPNPNRTQGPVSLFSISAIDLYLVEYNAERVRHLFFPLAPSRLSSVYAFGSEQDCNRAHSLYGWDLNSVRKFRLLPHALNRVQRANMEVVSLMRRAQKGGMWTEEDTTQIWKHYWNGGGDLQIEIPAIERGALVRKTISSGAIWEYLIEGRLELMDK
jgi:hypothetical protein